MNFGVAVFGCLTRMKRDPGAGSFDPSFPSVDILVGIAGLDVYDICNFWGLRAFAGPCLVDSSKLHLCPVLVNRKPAPNLETTKPSPGEFYQFTNQTQGVPLVKGTIMGGNLCCKPLPCEAGPVSATSRYYRVPRKAVNNNRNITQNTVDDRRKPTTLVRPRQNQKRLHITQAAGVSSKRQSQKEHDEPEECAEWATNHCLRVLTNPQCPLFPPGRIA